MGEKKASRHAKLFSHGLTRRGKAATELKEIYPQIFAPPRSGAGISAD